MSTIMTIFRRELKSYFVTPLAYVFIIIFLVLASLFTFELGGIYDSNTATLEPFFRFHPWLYLFLVPAIAMRLWAEERKSGTLELLFTLPVTVWQAVLGKFLAAWVFLGIALALTFPMWLMVNYLGNPDQGVIVASYLGSWLMAGGFLAIGSCLSACTNNQVIAFIITIVVCFLGFVVIGSRFLGVLNFLPDTLVNTLGSLSILDHYDTIQQGVLELRDAVYFILLIVVWLMATVVVINSKKA